VEDAFVRLQLSWYPLEKRANDKQLRDEACLLSEIPEFEVVLEAIPNMIKNAMEASSSGDKVLAGCHESGERHICFRLHEKYSDF
jgi:hypothetical protein